ncbi:MAG: hypothetical protein AB1333_03185 [Patescibacteria group bacterium]
MKENFKKGWIKFLIGWIVVFGIRFIPFRVPNIEPLTATQMPFAKKFGWLGGFVFGFLSILIFDAVTSGVGLWTWVTAGAYGFLGIGAAMFFKNRESTPANYLKFGIVATILYDAVTGLSIGPLFWGQSFMEAFTGQIPFTAYHLLGNIVFSLLVSPLIYRWVTENKGLEPRYIIERMRVVKK